VHWQEGLEAGGELKLHFVQQLKAPHFQPFSAFKNLLKCLPALAFYPTFATPN
jgi:hypothetical protein